MSEIQWAALTGFILGALVGAGIMTVINLRYIRGIMIAALKAERYTLEQYIEEEVPERE